MEHKLLSGVLLVQLYLSFCGQWAADGQISAACMHGCKCYGHVVKCDCDANPAGSVTSLTILPMSLAVAPTELEISNCKKVVYFPWSLYASADLRRVEISNVQDLVLQSNAFLDTQNASSIVIRNTAIQNLLPDSLGHIEGIHKIELDNVTISVIEPDAFGGLVNVSHFRIVNCAIGAIKTAAFPKSMTSLDNFAIVNTTIGALETGAIQMENVANVTFKNVKIEKWYSNAFAPSAVRHVSIRYSNFSEIHENGFAAQDVEALLVLHNRINELYPKAFGAIKRVKKFQFTDNVIHEVQRGTLFGYDRSAVALADISRNRLQCNGALCWLLEDDQGLFVDSSFMQSSVCHGPASYAGKTLQEIKTLRDDDDLCEGIEGSGKSAGLDVPLFESETQTSPVLLSSEMTSILSGQTTLAISETARTSKSNSNQNCCNVYLIVVVVMCVVNMCFNFVKNE